MNYHELYDCFLRGVERTRSRFGEFVDSLGVDLRGPTGPSSDIYLARVHFRCEIQQIITEEAIQSCDFNLLEKIGSLMAERLLRTIRKIILRSNINPRGLEIRGIKIQSDSDIPEGVMLIHPKTLRELLYSEDIELRRSEHEDRSE